MGRNPFLETEMRNKHRRRLTAELAAIVQAERKRRMFAANPMFSIPREQMLDLAIEPHQSLEKLRIGLADSVDVETLGSRINLGRLGVERFREAEHYADAVACAEAGVMAVTALRNRAAARGRIVATGDELRAIGAALCLADEVERQSSRLEIKRDLLTLWRHASAPGGASAPKEVRACK